jgi:hypothetical protein
MDHQAKHQVKLGMHPGRILSNPYPRHNTELRATASLARRLLENPASLLKANDRSSSGSQDRDSLRVAPGEPLSGVSRLGRTRRT